MDDSPLSSAQQDSPKGRGSVDEGAVLKWHKQDPEQQLGFRGGRYTDANKVLCLPMLVGGYKCTIPIQGELAFCVPER